MSRLWRPRAAFRARQTRGPRALAFFAVLVCACSIIDADTARTARVAAAAATWTDPGLNDLVAGVRPVPSPPAWTAATTMAHPPVQHPPGVADVVVHVPHGYDTRGPIHLVLLFHGSDQCVAQLALGGDVVCRPSAPPEVGAGVAWRHDDAGTMSVFAAPQLAFRGGGTAGRFAERGYFRAFVEELLRDTFAPGLGGPRSLDDLGSITLVGHSAGFLPVLAIVRLGDLADRVDNVVLLDALFGGGVDVLGGWIDAGIARGWPRKLVAIHGAWGHNVANGRAIAARIERRSAGSTVVDPVGDLADAVRAHVVTVKLWRHVEHAWMLLLTMSKAIAGLGLPVREVWPPAEPAAGSGAEPEPIAPGETRQATIDQGDARLLDGALADAYRIDLARGQRVTIEARGGPSFTEPCCSLDVVLRVAQGPRTLVEDDDSAGGFDARIQLVAPDAGTYLVRVSTYGSGERRGPYALRVF
jgi:Bacterial pre-peptidase C-terminal domain